MKKKIIVAVIFTAMLFSYFLPLTDVFANSSTSKLSISFRSGSEDYGKVQYSLDDGNNWSDVTTNKNNMAITVTGNNLRLKIVPNANYRVDYAGIELRLDEENIQNVSDYGLESANGYAIDSNVSEVSLTNVEFRSNSNNNQQLQGGNTDATVSLTLTGSTLEYDKPWDNTACDFVFGINGAGMRSIMSDEVDYTTSYSDIVGLTTADDLDYSYNYNGEGTVTFNIKTQWDDVIESIYINDTEYSVPKTKDELIAAFNPEFRGISFDIPNVPYAAHYSISVEARKQYDNEKIMGNFGWTYDENSNEYSDDDKIPHGTLEFVKAVYDGTTYNTVEAVNNVGGVFQWKNANKSNDPFGEAMFPVGTSLTVKLIPDAGYQLTALTLNGTAFTPGEEIGVYTFTIKGGNWHLGANFTEVGNEVKTNSNNIIDGNIRLNVNGDNSFKNGTAKLEVKDVNNLSNDRINEFTATAEEEGYEVSSYIDMSLYNTIYKGGKKDGNGEYQAWNTQVDNLKNEASITLELNEDMTGKTLALVHEKHNGETITGYELVDAAYNEENNTITFRTNSFSNYAIVVRDSYTKDYEVKDNDGNSIKFKKESGHIYNLTITDFLTFTDKDLEESGIDKDEYNQTLKEIKNVTKKEGELLAFLDIKVTDENDNEIHEGPFTIKIKMTDKMKKYNAFKIIYVDPEDEFKTEEPITLTVDGDYLVGTINHLSTYAVTGTLKANPDTGDMILKYVAILGISALGFAGIKLYSRKKAKNN